MSFKRVRLAVLATIACLVAAVVATTASASDPSSQDVTAPPLGQTTTITWTGTIDPQINPTRDCNSSPSPDQHQINFKVPSFPPNTVVEATFKISWTPAFRDASTNDEIITVNDSKGNEVGSSDTSNTTETLTENNLPSDTYTVLACGDVNTTPQPYTGTLTVVTRAPEPSLPSADNQGLQFGASVPADQQRDESEPLMTIGRDGRIYTCGPTGFSNASDYAQVSTDGGDQFHLLGTPPRGQQGAGGGGDCGLATAPDRNGAGFFQYAYAGLGPLTGFTTSTSPDGGRTIYNAGPQGNTNTAQGGGADRQWLTFLDDHTVLLSYNQQRPRNIVVQKSTDGGFSYLTGNDTVAAGNPSFPGPMHSMPASLVTPGATGRVAYFGWNTSDANFSYVAFAISDNTGLSWKNCLVRKIPRDQSGGLQAFTVADNDDAGNIYLSYADKKAFHTYLTTLTVDKLRNCSQAPQRNLDPTGLRPTSDPSKLQDPGWSTPVQVDRDAVRTTIFPWLVAEGAPGRVAVAYYGSETDGDPNPGSFKASWNVYVDQSLNALSASPTFGQTQVTTHPFHYDSICLNGLGCNLSNPPGDRSLADFFAIDYNRVTKRLSVVYDRTNKKPDEAGGRLATPLVATQIAGPSNGGGTVAPDPARATVRQSTQDPTGDALVDFSHLVPGPPGTPSMQASQKNEPAMDFVSEAIGPELDAKGREVPNGGFTATLKLADLSSGALQQALSDTSSGSLLWIFRFTNGYTDSAASARYNGSSFSFGYDDFTAGRAQCGSDRDKCVIYPGAKPIQGTVDQRTGTITLSVPRAYLRALTGSTGPGERPVESRAVPGTRFYDASAFSLANTSPDPSTQSFLYPADNLRAMDFVLPGPLPPGAGSAGFVGSGRGARGNRRGAGACVASYGFSIASVRPRGGRLQFAFRRTRRAGQVTIDVFQASLGRTVLGLRQIAHFGHRVRGFAWDGRPTRSRRRAQDGIYMVRYRTVLGRGRVDIRRFVVQRIHGRFVRRPDFFLAGGCRAVTFFKLDSPAFGGVHNRPLYMTFRLARPANVTLTVLRGRRVIKRVRFVGRRVGSIYRRRLASERLARGDYRVRLVVNSGGTRATYTLTARRL